MSKLNKNDQLIESINELAGEMNWDDFPYKERFKLICNLIPNRNKEKIDIEPIGDNRFHEIKSIVYVMVIEGKILKIGQSINSMKSRVQSYNCGKKKYRKGPGTNSTTNHFILQSLLKIDKPVIVYGHFPDKCRCEVFGEYVGEEAFPPPKNVERKILKDIKDEYGKLPIGCTQQ